MHPIRSGRAAIAALAAIAILVAGCGATASSPALQTGSPAASVPAASGPETTARVPSAAPSAGPSSAPAGSFDPTGQTVQATVSVTGFSSPLDVANAGDGSGRLFVVEQGGRIRVVRDGAILSPPFLDISDRITSGGERGLLGLTFHPDYPADRRFFVDYTDRDGGTVIAQYTVSAADPNVADPASETILLHIEQPYSNHNGGAVEFGPDGMLYVAMGDGGSAGDPQGNGQNLDTLLAKILRIDVAGPGPNGAPYRIPADNPFVATVGARPEIWLTGLRNPWRMRFDRSTGDLWIGDVGQGAWEEIDVARAGTSGQDYGWNRMEGFHCYEPSSGCDQTGLTLPITEYGHDNGCAVIGGVVVRDARQGLLDGGYLFGDDCSDNLWLIDPAGDEQREPTRVAQMGRSLSSIGEGEDGTVYATSLGTGELLRLSAPGR